MKNSLIAANVAVAFVSLIALAATKDVRLHAASINNEGHNNPCAWVTYSTNQTGVCLNPLEIIFDTEQLKVRLDRMDQEIRKETERQYRLQHEQADWLPSNRTY